MLFKRLRVVSPLCGGVFVLMVVLLAECFAAGLVQRIQPSTLRLPLSLQATNYTFESFRGLPPIWCLAVVAPPGETNRIFGVNQSGGIVVIPDLNSPVPEVFLDISSRTYHHQESGLLGLAFHPGFASNGFFYVFYSTLAQGAEGRGIHNRLSRFQVDPANPNRGLAGSEQILISQFDEDPNHNAGDLHFGPDGYLYVALGDEGGGNDLFQNGGRLDKDFFGGILRIDVDHRPGNLAPNPHPAVTPGAYKIPRDNPFVGITNLVVGGTELVAKLDSSKVRTEFYAFGFRNPWRLSFDELTGALYAFDVGEDSREEVNKVIRGGFYGWPFREGTLNWPWEVPEGGMVDPLFEYEHASGHLAITGGFLYRGNLYPELRGAFVFSDMSGAIGVSRLVGGRYEIEWIAQFPGLIFSMARNPAGGEIFFLDGTTGYLMTLKRRVVAGSSLPGLLSETGIFEDLKTLTPNPGVESYDINVPFWSDHAIKRRWFALPDADAMLRFDPTNNWEFPEGMVWIKHFDMEMSRGDSNSIRRLETRVLVRQLEGVYGATYRWKPDASDAVLVSPAGADEVLSIQEADGVVTQRWRYPSQLECLGCHTGVGGYALGFNTAQLNRNKDSGAGVAGKGQLQQMAEAGYFVTQPASFNLLPRLVRADEAHWSLEYRVRSYLAANCAHCHQPGGQSRANWDARIHVPMNAAGIIGALPATSWSSGNTRIVAPGDVQNSVLFRRVADLAGGHMPPLGTSVLDEASIRLLRDWIESDLPARQRYTEWVDEHFDEAAGFQADWDADPDTDGSSNESEHLLGTDPLDATSVWHIRVTTQDGGVRIVFPRVPNLVFEVQARNSLDSKEEWRVLDIPENQPFVSGEEAFSEVRLPATGRQQFFRVEIRIP